MDCIPDQRSFLWVIDNADKLIRVNDRRGSQLPGKTQLRV